MRICLLGGVPKRAKTRRLSSDHVANEGENEVRKSAKIIKNQVPYVILKTFLRVKHGLAGASAEIPQWIIQHNVANERNKSLAKIHCIMFALRSNP